MPSPFPGMNPYLEQDRAWSDFHESFMPAARDAIAAQVRPYFIAKINELLFIHELPEDSGRFMGRADVSVTRPPSPTTGDGTAVATVEAPAKVRLPAVDIEPLSFIEIRDRDDWQLVTVIELLSPSNKYAGADREQYLIKRRQLLASTVHFVEIDLLRGGPRMPMHDLPECDYCVLVSRAEVRPEAGLWPIRLRDPLPPVPIPLRPPHADAQIDLQGLLHHIYDAAGYEDYIYRGQPQPQLNAEDAVWRDNSCQAEPLKHKCGSSDLPTPSTAVTISSPVATALVGGTPRSLLAPDAAPNSARVNPCPVGTDRVE